MTTISTPYVCPNCGHGWTTPYTRCIGTDGTHRPAFPIVRIKGGRFSA